MEERLQYIREYVAAAAGTSTGVIFGGACIWQMLCAFVIGMHDAMIMMREIGYAVRKIGMQWVNLADPATIEVHS